ncbi:MAG: hypothetical protein ACRC6B_07680, partial [Fusobacteriaceae bacterium]
MATKKASGEFKVLLAEVNAEQFEELSVDEGSNEVKSKAGRAALIELFKKLSTKIMGGDKSRKRFFDFFFAEYDYSLEIADKKFSTEATLPNSTEYMKINGADHNSPAIYASSATGYLSKHEVTEDMNPIVETQDKQGQRMSDKSFHLLMSLADFYLQHVDELQKELSADDNEFLLALAFNDQNYFKSKLDLKNDGGHSTYSYKGIKMYLPGDAIIFLDSILKENKDPQTLNEIMSRMVKLNVSSSTSFYLGSAL